MGTLALPRESYSSLGSVFIIGTGEKKNRKKYREVKKRAGNPRGVASVHNWAMRWAGTIVATIPSTIQTNNHQYGLSVKLAEFSHRETFLPTPLYHTVKKSKKIGGGGEEEWMNHQFGKPQLVLIMSKTHFLWTLLWLWYPIKDYFKALLLLLLRWDWNLLVFSAL